MFGVDDALGAVVGLAETTVGIINAGKTKRKAAALEASRPKLKNSPFIQDELGLAKSELSTGMGAEATTAYEEGLSRDFSESVGAVLKGGGDVNSVSSIFDKSAQGRQRLALMKENLRLNEINNLTRAQDAAEEERQKMFQYNEYAPWVDKTKANAQQREAANQMIWKGLDTAAGTVMKGVEGDKGTKQTNDYFTV